MKDKISVCIPVYNGATTIVETIRSILNQSYKKFELVIVDNHSSDNTIALIKSIKDERIKLYQNKTNIGTKNLDECRKKAQGDIVFYMCADDILHKYALEKVVKAFSLGKDIGMVTRPYYWFDKNISIPVRIKKQYLYDEVITIQSSFDKIKDIISLSDQVSGIGFRKKYMKGSFSHDKFVEMPSMFVPLIKKYKTVLLCDNLVAVCIGSSGTRNASIFVKSPVMNWYNLINNNFKEKKYQELRKYLINNLVANNYIGLVQIKSFSGNKNLLREIYYLLKLKWKNIFSPPFWFYTIITLITPSPLLIKITEFYKNKINSKLIKNINFEYNLSTL